MAEPRKKTAVPVGALIDNLFFVFGGLAAVWLAVLLFTESFSVGWFGIAVFVGFWVLLAYLVLPRLHRILTRLYVPGYFIGRARTSDGLLGDPINLGARGTEAQLHAAMTAAGWTRADPVSLRSGIRIVTSTLTRRPYAEAPVSPLFLFDRMQDFAYQQEVEGNPSKRHHVRFWRCPDGWMLPGGHRVDWVAAGTFDRAVGFSLFTLQITHKIDENTDIERDHIVSTLTNADVGVSIDVIRDFSTGYHSRNGGGDTIQTDGDLPIVDAREVDPSTVDGAELAPVIMRDDAAGDGDRQRARRPAALTAGVLLILLRALTGVLYIAVASTNRDAFVDNVIIDFDQFDLSPDERANLASLILGVLLSAYGVVLLALLALAAFVFFGWNWARLLAMLGSTISIVFAFVDFVTGGADITLRTTMPTIASDILVVLALSSRAAREYSRRSKRVPSRPRSLAAS